MATSYYPSFIKELEEIFTVGNKDKMEIINNIQKKDNQP